MRPQAQAPRLRPARKLYRQRVAAAPALPVLALIRAMPGYLVEEEDEYERMLRVRGFVLATGLVLAITTIRGLLQIYAGLPRISLFYVFVIFVPCLAFATSWVSWRASR